MLLLSKQAEDFTIQSGATIVTDADSSSNPTNNAVLILQGPENISWNFGSMPVGATKYQVFLKKQTIGISDASININLIGSGSPQYSAGVATLTTEGLHSIQFTTLPTAGNNEMNIDGNKLIIDRIEWHDDTVAGTITIIDQTLPPVTAGTNGNAIALTAPTTTSCADSGNRTVIGMGVGITLKKNGVVLAVNGTFTASDTLTYDVASNVPTTTAHNIFLYKAAGACGDSNVASITANVTAAAVGTISIIDQTLPPVTAGTNGNAIALTAPTTTSCADSGNRTVIGMGVDITLKKNGVVLAVNGTFTASDTLTYDVASNVTTTTAHNIFLYKAAGACGDSNVASITANVTAAAVGTITIIDQTLPPVTAGTNGVVVAFTAPTSSGCTDTNGRILIDNGVGITVKKNGVTMAISDTFLASDVITYDIPSNVATTTAYNILRYKAVGACGNSNLGILTANVTAAAVGTITIIDQTLPPVTAGTNGVVVAFTAPTTSGCTDTNGRILIDNGVGITVKKNGVTMAISDTFLASDVITYDILSNVATTTAYNILRYKAVGACGNSNLGILTANVTAAAVGTITIIDQTLPPVTAGTNGVIVAFTAPTTSGCTDTNGRILIDNGVGITVKKNGVTMAMSDTFLASDVITYDILSNVATTTAYNILRYKAVGACGNSNLGILTANVTAAAVGTITIIDQTLPPVTAGTNGVIVAFTAPTTSGCTDTNGRILIDNGVGITVKKNGVTMAMSDTFLASDVITYDILSNVATTTAYNILRYKAVGACGNSNLGILTANVTATTVVVNSITIGGQTIASLISGSTANSLISLVAPVVIGACVFSGVRRLTAISVGVTIKKNNVAMIVGTTFTSSDIITTDIAISITAQNNKELFRYVALGACGDSNEAIILGNIIAATVSGGGYSAAPARATASTNAPAASNNTSWYWAISALLIGAVFTMILSLSRKGKAIKKNK